MKSVRNACTLQPNALEITVGDQIEQLDEIIRSTDTAQYFAKTFITGGMRDLLEKGVTRLAGKSNNSIFHLKQAMGGGKTHLMVGFGLLAKSAEDRAKLIGDIPHQAGFGNAKIAAFNGRNTPAHYFWGEIASQLGKEVLFKPYWESGTKAPDENAWLELFDGDEPVLILLDEMPPYFQYYATQSLGQGTIADVVTRAFSCLLTAAQKKKNVCVVVSDLSAAYDTGGKLIQRALDDAKQELGRAEVSITPVNLESDEIYQILRKRLFLKLPDKNEIADIAGVFADRLSEAAKARSIERGADALANDIESTYPFHPSFKSIVALFKDNEKFKQTRGLMELVSRLLKSVWNSPDDVYLIGAQHFDLGLPEVREKLTEISNMRDVIARDLWDSGNGAHAQMIDLANGNSFAKQVGVLLLTSSLSTSVDAVRGLSEQEMLECLIDPNRKASDFRPSFEALLKSAWYLHKTQEGRHYFSHAENLTKKLENYAEKAPQPKVDELIRTRLNEMYRPLTKEAYEKVLPLPEIDEAEASIKSSRSLLIISPDGKTPPEAVARFFANQTNKNNVLVLTGDRSSMADLEKAARHVYAAAKAHAEIDSSHPQRAELDDKKTQYDQDFQSTVLNVFDKVLFPGKQGADDILRSKVLDGTYPAGEPYNGERQIIKTLTNDPIKLYTDVEANFDALKARAEQLLFGNQDDVRKTDLIDKARQSVQMPWLPTRGFDMLLQAALQRGNWEDLGNGYITKKPRPKTTKVIIKDDIILDDAGTSRLTLETQFAGPVPRIHYAEEGPVSEQSPVLAENTLVTKALRVQFLAVDPGGANLTGAPTTWTNDLTIRNHFHEEKRLVELFVAPRGTIRYTTDGTEPREGTLYTGPIDIGKEAVTILVYAECEGLENKRTFKFAAAGSSDVLIAADQPATFKVSVPRKLDSSAKAYEGIRVAKERGITFQHLSLQLGSSPKVIQVTLGDMKIDAEFIEKTLTHLQSLLEPDAPVVLSFKQVNTPSGHDLEQFAKALGIELKNEDIIQE
jgi:hypothetical protein